ncbi:MAG: hypothetical protein WCE21_04075 [Candidatus Babeliales bacterium]
MKRSAVHAILAFIAIVNFYCSSFAAGETAEKPIAILIYASNPLYYELNLSSALSQKYNNFRIFYIDDGLHSWVLEGIYYWIREHDTQRRVTIITDHQQKGLLGNYWSIIHKYIEDDEIVIHLRADDWFEHEHVLKHINELYQDESTWMTYAQFMVYPTMQPGYCKQYPESVVLDNSWRKQSLLLPYSHLCTFYGRLFKNIKLQDFIERNGFFPCAFESAFMYPMLEMAGNHVQFVPELLYIYNKRGINVPAEQNIYLKMAVARYIQEKQEYKPLRTLSCEAVQCDGVDIIVFSFNRPMQLYALLESIERHMSGVGNISILYRVTNDEYERGYKLVKDRFKKVKFVPQIMTPRNEFKMQTVELVRQSSAYLMFGVDDIIVKDKINLKDCVSWIEKTKAYGFYLRLGKNIKKCYFPQAPINPDSSIKPYIELDHHVCAWEFQHGSHDWKYPNTLDMTIYRRDTALAPLTNLLYQTPNMLEGLWFGIADYQGIGLSYSFSKIVNLPLNVVQDDEFNNPHTIDIAPEKLLRLFLDGLKIDIDAVYQINNESAHIDFIPPLVVRI